MPHMLKKEVRIEYATIIKHENKQSVSADQRMWGYLSETIRSDYIDVFWYFHYFHMVIQQTICTCLRLLYAIFAYTGTLFSADDLCMPHSDCSDVGRCQVQRFLVYVHMYVHAPVRLSRCMTVAWKKHPCSLICLCHAHGPAKTLHNHVRLAKTSISLRIRAAWSVHMRN